MKVLRSRVVPTPTEDNPQMSTKPSETDPVTPMDHQLTSSPSTPGSVPESGSARTLPPPPRRRSLRLLPGQGEATEKPSELETGDGVSETRVIQSQGNVRVLDAGPVESAQESSTSRGKDKGKRKLNSDDGFGCDNGGGPRGFMSLRSGKSVAKRGKNAILAASFDLNLDPEREIDEIVLGGVGRESAERMHLGSSVFEGFSRSEVKDDKLPEIAKSLSKGGPGGSGTRHGTNYNSAEAVEKVNFVRGDNWSDRIDIAAPVPVEDPQNALLDGNAPVVEDIPSSVLRANTQQRRNLDRNVLPDPVDHMERFREIARRNASRFAHFNPEDEFGYERVVLNGAPVQGAPTEEDQDEIEDWPGPFSTAMKIVRDRTVKKGFPGSSSSSDKSKSPSIKWVPCSGCRNQKKRVAPSLMELCLKFLAANADAVMSLEGVPDAQRHKLSQLLCDSRKMNYHVFGLLIKGSPSEVRIKDCSWLTEEELDESFKACDTSKLTVLQLDQCGRCLPDYILLSSIAQSANCFPLLSTISITGACRLTDDGLARLALSVPALRSLNLSQCSLLTFKSIETLATTSGSMLKELYIDDCQCIDPILMLPALKKLEGLEVLSLAGIPLSDDFIEEFISVQGHKMKELILRDCVNLTDTSFKVIGDKCSGLCAINLVNLTKLTDYSIGYLANGCQAIEKLVLCRNTFSDEAIAAFLEIAGKELKELSLNNVKKVSSNTAVSLAKTAKKLESLDASWCRELSDEAVGLIVDSCLSLKHLRVFGCTQISDLFVNGHSNPEVEVVGLRMSAFLEQCRKDVIQLPSKYMSLE